MLGGSTPAHFRLSPSAQLEGRVGEGEVADVKEQRAPLQSRVWLLLACPTRRLSSSKSSPTGWRARCLSTPTSPSTGCSCSAYSTSRGGLPASTPEHHLRQSGLTPPVPF